MSNTFRQMLRVVACKVLSTGARLWIQWNANQVCEYKMALHLSRFRKKVWNLKYRSLGTFLHYVVRITDGPNFYIQYKDEFVRRIYHFEAVRPEPLIIDGGSNIGISILYFKHVYPTARIIGFEPDPKIFKILQENITRNNIKNVTLIKAGLGSRQGEEIFLSDGTSGGQVVDEGEITVHIECLSDYLNEQVDFLKLNIEGEELHVLEEVESSGKLRNVRELVLEYHGWADGEQRLGAILDILVRQGFRYLIHNFDAETCSTTKPPFRLNPKTTWFCLVYAKRINEAQSSIKTPFKK